MFPLAPLIPSVNPSESVIVLFLRKSFCVSDFVCLMGEVYSDIGIESTPYTIYSERILRIIAKGQKHWGSHDNRTLNRSKPHPRRPRNRSAGDPRRLGHSGTVAVCVAEDCRGDGSKPERKGGGKTQGNCDDYQDEGAERQAGAVHNTTATNDNQCRSKC